MLAKTRGFGLFALTLTCLSGCGAGSGTAQIAQPSPPTGVPLVVSQPVSLIIDTDLSGDVDDVGALAIANALVDKGEAKLLAVMVNTPSRWGAPAAEVVNTWYGHGSIPVGTAKPVDDSQPAGTAAYPQYLATHFPNNVKDGANAPDAVALYRQILAQQPDQSVVIASVGFLNNLSGLLNSKADSFSTLDGTALVAKKVKFLNVMGGDYPQGYEYNFNSYPSVTQAVINAWPTRIVYIGFSVGATVLTGSRLSSETPASNPVRVAYELYLGGPKKSRSSWDPISIYTAVRGSDMLFLVAGSGGTNYLYNTGANSFLPKSTLTRDESYLIKTATDAQIATKLEDLMVQAPKP